MNNKVILGCQLLFWLSLISIFGLFLSFIPPLNNSLVFPIVLIGFLSIYFVSGYYGKLIEKEFYLISIEKIAQHQPIPLSMTPALNNIIKWEADKEENEKAKTINKLFKESRVLLEQIDSTKVIIKVIQGKTK